MGMGGEELQSPLDDHLTCPMWTEKCLMEPSADEVVDNQRKPRAEGRAGQTAR